VLVTRRRDGELAVALWNPFVDGQQRGSHMFVLQLSSPPFPARAQVQILDAERGDLNAAYLQMGRPRYPTPAQYRQLQQAARLPPPWRVPIKGGLAEAQTRTHRLTRDSPHSALTNNQGSRDKTGA
jgi:xylan 1,4-beta-xylosidase